MGTLGLMAVGSVLTLLFLVWLARRSPEVVHTQKTNRLETYRELLAERVAVTSALANGRMETDEANDLLDRLDNQIRAVYQNLSEWERHVADCEEGEEWKRL